jgi:hypothetical protein
MCLACAARRREIVQSQQWATPPGSFVRRRLVGPVAVLALLVAALLGAQVARAANSFVPAGEIGSGELEGPARVAVDQASGDVLVVDGTKNRVDVYGSSGPGAALLTTFGESDLSGPYGIAVDPTDGDVYVTDPGHERILRYTTDGASPPTYTLDAGYTGPAAGTGSEQVGSFSSAIAVDPTDGDLLVADRGDDRVERFGPTGAFVSSFDGSDSPGGAFTHLEDVTLSPAGKIFVADGEAAAGGPSRVLRFANGGTYEATLRSSEPTGDAYLAYDSAHTELIVGDARECFFCNASVHVLDPGDGTTLFDVTVPSEQITGIAADPGSGRLYAASARGEFFAPAKVEVLAPQTHPDLVLNSPGPVTSFTAHLSGTIDPDGVATEYHFEISKDGGTTWQKSPEPDASAGEGATPVAVESDFAVEPNNHYIARLVATNTDGVQDATPPVQFVTGVEPPETNTLAAADLTETSAVLRGTVNPFGLQTTYYFEYGPTAAYGSRAPAGVEVAGQGHGTKAVSHIVSGLTAGTTYHFRLVASSSAGSEAGPDRTFTTVASGAAVVRRYEQVTPPDKEGAAITSHLGSLASPDGNGITYITKSGSNSSPIFARSMAIRGSTDWKGRIDLDPPLNEGAGGFLIHPTLAVSSDSTHALVASNRALTPGAVENGGNLYLLDITSGKYQLIGASGAEGAFNSFVGTLTNNVFQAGAPDFSWIVFSTSVPMLPGAPKNAIYRWTQAAGLEVVSVLPDGAATSTVHGNALYTYHAVSADGTRIFFTGYGGAEEGVFLHEVGAGTRVVSHLSGDPASVEPGILLGTDENGRYAFLVSPAKLTADAPGEAHDLYRYDAANGGLEYLKAQAYLNLLENSSGRVTEGGSFGIGSDGDTVYFLGGGSTTGFQVWHDGAVHTVSSTMNLQMIGGQERPSPDGRYYVFSESVSESGKLLLYDAGTNQLTCVTCLSDGTSFEAELPAKYGYDTVVNNRLPRAVSNDGTVYFDTTARLVASDVNGTRDVYSYHGGSFTLLSPGDQPFNAYLADVSESGNDVFFTTEQKLVGRDNDKTTDIYDARINGGLPAQDVVAEAECVRNCKPTPSGRPASTDAGSERLSGAGNVKPTKKKARCRKGRHRVKVRGKARCVKKRHVHHRHHRHHGHKGGTNGNGGNR